MKVDRRNFFSMLSFLFHIKDGKRDGRELFNAFLMVLLLIAGAFAVVVFRWSFQESRNDFITGKPSPRIYYALSTMRYIDNEATAVLRSRATQKISGVLVRNEASIKRIRQQLESLRIGTEKSDELPEDLVHLMSTLSESQKDSILEIAIAIGTDILSIKNTYGEKESGPDVPHLWRMVDAYDLVQADKNIVYQLLVHVLPPVVKVDPQMTQKMREVVSREVAPVERIIHTGDVIVEKGEFITPQIAMLLTRQGYPKGTFPLGQLLLVLGSICISWCWIIQEARRQGYVLTGFNRPFYLVFLLIMGWLTQYLSDIFSVGGIGVLPLAGCAYLTLRPLFAFHLVLVGGITGALVVGGNSASAIVSMSLMSVIMAFAGFLMFREIYSRLRLWRELFFLGMITGLAGLSVNWTLEYSLNFMQVVYYIFWGALWSTAVVMLLPLVEDFFDILSPLRLMELSHPTHPLLRRLQMEAPGTYHHSQMVGTLAENVADKLKINSLLVRAGAYYHDIGKLRRPHFFVENQFQEKNIHDDISPALSALVIIAHVREGLELAKEYKLPQRIRDFIGEHHGTTSLSYFYRKARRMNMDVSEEQFCYPGPTPQSKETGVLMIADSVEAAARAGKSNITGIQDLKKIIDSVIDNKLEGGQLDHVDFTLKDLTLIRETLLLALQSMYHTRRVKEIPVVGEQNDQEGIRS